MNIPRQTLFQNGQCSTNGKDNLPLPFADWKKYVYLSSQLGYNIHRCTTIVSFHTESEGSAREIVSFVMIGAAADALISKL